MLDPELAERITAAVSASTSSSHETPEPVRYPSLRTGEVGAQDLIEVALTGAGCGVDGWAIGLPEFLVNGCFRQSC
ncbi:hypothetical protein L3Q67_26445 [Saccharothrix sp. AJ9571]|nr:hypothetical protein L3Q67_26445 [Saccharothrix sp. AJ9571]